MKRLGRSALTGALMAAGLVVSGCATVMPDRRSDQEIVAEKSQQRWKTLVASDFDAAYEFISPAGRSVVTRQGYKSSLKPGFWKDARINEVKCASPELCEVHLEIEYEYVGRRTRSPLTEKWVKQDGSWWFLLER